MASRDWGHGRSHAASGKRRIEDCRGIRSADVVLSPEPNSNQHRNVRSHENENQFLNFLHPEVIKTKPTMKTKNKIIHAMLALTQAQWLRQTVLTLALFMPLFGVDGCGHKH